MRLKVILLVPLLLSLLATPARPFGQRYRGPYGEVPPTGRETWARLPRPDGSPPPRGPVGPLGDDRPFPSGRRDRPVPRALREWSWNFWWYTNRAAIADALASRRGRTAEESRVVEETIRPALLRSIADEDLHPMIRADAVVALARVAMRGEVDDLLVRLARDGDLDRAIQEAALAGLGLSGSTDGPARAARLAIADDPAAPERLRGFALFATGLAGDRSDEARECLRRRLGAADEPPEIARAALFAIRLSGEPRWAPDLTLAIENGRFGERELGPELRADAISALGRVGGPETMGLLEKALADEFAAPQRAAAIAVGEALESDPKAARRFGRWLPRADRPWGFASRGLMLLSAGRLAAAGERGAVDRPVRETLMRTALDPNDVADYAILALAGMGRGDPATRDFVRARLRVELDKGDAFGGAAALAAGLVGDDREETRALLRAVLSDGERWAPVRGAAATALALLGDRGAAAQITALTADRKVRSFPCDTIFAAGLLPAEGTTAALLSFFRDPKSSGFHLSEAARALGRMRAFDAAPELLSLLADPELPGLCRAEAAVALGWIGSRKTDDEIGRAAAGTSWWDDFPARQAFLSIE